MRGLYATVAVAIAAVCGALSACGSDDDSRFNDASDAGQDGTFDPSFEGPIDAYTGPYADFPKDPIIDTADGGGSATPQNAPQLFAGGSAGGADVKAPCLVEPEIGSMVPRNWLRPRFRWVQPGGSNLFEIRVHAANQTNDLVVYTRSSAWVMPDELWKAFREHSAGFAITIGVRGGKLDGETLTEVTPPMSGDWSVAPVDAPGSIVYWRIGGGGGELKGFDVGDDGVRDILDPTKVQQGPDTQCVGCHVSSPDGKFAIVSSDDYGPPYGVGIASIEQGKEGQRPDFLTDKAASVLEGQLRGISTTAGPLWTAGKHIVVGSSNGALRWVNLDATTDPTVTGVIARTGDTKTKPNSPNLSHDGATVLYISADQQTDGRPSTAATDSRGLDLYTVPYADGAGGQAKAIDGAATAEWDEYYPSFSPDDRLVTFNRIAKGQDPYHNDNAEVFVIASAGGEPQRLSANDPPSCVPRQSPGIENSWPKWAPAKPSPATVDGRTYYWVVFSSTRNGTDNNRRQLFMAPVVVGADGKVAPYKATYLWNQPANENNHTPAWDVFVIPPQGPR